jgi:hypothetical protein
MYFNKTTTNDTHSQQKVLLSVKMSNIIKQCPEHHVSLKDTLFSVIQSIRQNKQRHQRERERER